MNPADSLIAHYQKADSLTAWNVEMIYRCRLTQGGTLADVLLRAQWSFRNHFN